MQPKLFFSNEPLKPISQLLLFLHVVNGRQGFKGEKNQGLYKLYKHLRINSQVIVYIVQY